MSPLDKARELILSITTASDATADITRLSALAPDELHKQLETLYNTTEEKAAAGNTQAISIMLRILEHFGDTSHDRMLLHYIAQAEANKALKTPDVKQSPELQEALQIIAQAFADADAINDVSGIK